MTSIIQGNALTIPLADESVQMVMTSPPYWGLRSYGIGTDQGELGLEPTPEQYIENMVAVFREVRRVLRSDGVLWLNLGDSYATNRNDHVGGGFGDNTVDEHPTIARRGSFIPTGLKKKDLIGIPWRVALALQADGWWLRSDIIWHKPNPMPESVTDRPTKSHEYVFLMTKSARYFYDADAVREDISDPSPRESGKKGRVKGTDGISQPDWLNNPDRYDPISGRNRRTVWTIPTAPYSGAHFATYPPALVEPCIKAGSREGDVVFDPFVGSGTTLMVARQLGRHGVGLDLSAEYLGLARERLELDKLEAWESGRTDPGNGQPELTDLPLFKEAP